MVVIAMNEGWSYRDLVQAITDPAFERVGKERKLSNLRVTNGDGSIEI